MSTRHKLMAIGLISQSALGIGLTINAYYRMIDNNELITFLNLCLRVIEYNPVVLLVIFFCLATLNIYISVTDEK